MSFTSVVQKLLVYFIDRYLNIFVQCAFSINMNLVLIHYKKDIQSALIL